MPQDPLPTAAEKGNTLYSKIYEQLTAILSIDDELNRVQALLALVPYLPEPLIRTAFESIPSIRDERLRANAFVGIAPYLDDRQITHLYEIISRFGSAAVRTEALGQLFAQLNVERHKAVQERIVADITGNEDRFVRLKAWAAMAPSLSAAQKQDAISTALQLSNEEERAEALVALAQHLPDVWKLKALESVRKIFSPLTRVQALSGLIPTLPKQARGSALNEALTLARTLSSDRDKASALLKLYPLMPSELKGELFHETEASIVKVTNITQRVEMFIELAETLRPDIRADYLRPKALEAIEAVKDNKLRGQALLTLAVLGPPDLHPRILDVAMQIEDKEVRADVIIQLQDVMVITPPASAPAPAAAPGPQQGVSQSQTGAVIDFPAAEGEVQSAKPVSEPTPETSESSSALDLETNEPILDKQEEVADLEHLPPVAGSKAAEQAKQPKASPGEEATDSSSTEELIGVKAYLHSDRWTLDDQLNYSLPANAIAEFILHPNTEAPLAIGILAPWGQGKTTLMRLIQNQIRSKSKQATANQPVVVAPITPKLTFAYLRGWLRDPTKYKLEVTKLDHPTVWVNAWKYQDSEQVWAGMAYSILSQLVGQISDQGEREKFWLALQAERVDFNAIRQDIHRMIFERVAPWIGISMVIAAIGLLLIVVGYFAGNAIWGSSGGIVMLAGVLLPAVKWLLARVKIDSKPLEGKFAQYVRQPTYEGKLGFLHEIEMDVQRVFGLLIEKDKPVVVFIDDLDRCSPGTVSQVIEAMNLFLSLDFPDCYCYFVVGMDAQVVAASVEAAYENLDKRMKSLTRSYGSLGWYFMEKFMQLQFNIPNLTADQRGAYLAKLLGRNLDKKEYVPAFELDIVEEQLQQTLNSTTLKAEELPQQAEQLSKLRLQRPQAWQSLAHTLIETSAKKLSDDSLTLHKYLDRYEPFLGVSPRGIKRFATFFRFYTLSQLSRRSQGLPACSPGALARWLVIMLRWPQVVRWIQWEGEGKLSEGTSAFQRAQDLEEQLLKTKDHAAWLAYLDKLDPNHSEWMSDRQLYEFLKTAAGADEKLSFAVKTGVW